MIIKSQKQLTEKQRAEKDRMDLVEKNYREVESRMCDREYEKNRNKLIPIAYEKAQKRVVLEGKIKHEARTTPRGTYNHSFLVEYFFQEMDELMKNNLKTMH